MTPRVKALLAVVRRHRLSLDETIILLNKLNMHLRRPIRTNKISLKAYNKLNNGIIVPK